MTDLDTIQPIAPSRLTRLTDVVRVERKRWASKHFTRCVIALCECGALMAVLAGHWVDGSKRPRMCQRCNHELHRRTRTKPQRVERAPILPFPDTRVRRGRR